MPLYEYQCDSCGHRFETIQKFSDPPLEKCPKCGSQLRKLIASPAFQFKGTGWYITDYAKKKDPDAKEKSGSSDPAEKSSSEKSDKSAKTDSSATKSDPPATPTSSAKE
jgi:putative FmdB family regulatory protein